jgi:uncharacterized Tic20 family protein
MSDDAPPPPPPTPPPASAPTPPEPGPSQSGSGFSTTGLPPGPAFGSGKLSATDDKTFCILSHVLSVVVSVLGPLIIWLLKKDESPAVDAHGKEALNFQLNIVGWFLISAILAVATCGILSFLPFVVLLYSVVLSVLAAIKANEGQLMRYPFTWRLVK